MNKYTVKLLPKVYRDIDQIYSYISKNLMMSETAKNIVRLFEDAIINLEEFPYRGTERKIGMYANKGYRQLFIKNFIIIYRIDENNKYVIIVTVKYIHSEFWLIRYDNKNPERGIYYEVNLFRALSCINRKWWF